MSFDQPLLPDSAFGSIRATTLNHPYEGQTRRQAGAQSHRSKECRLYGSGIAGEGAAFYRCRTQLPRWHNGQP